MQIWRIFHCIRTIPYHLFCLLRKKRGKCRQQSGFQPFPPDYMPKTKCFLKGEMKGKNKKQKEEVDAGEEEDKEGKEEEKR